MLQISFLTLQIFHANQRRTRGSRKKAVFRRSIKISRQTLKSINTDYQFNSNYRENSSATVYIHVDFSNNPALFLDSMKMMLHSRASQFQSSPEIKLQTGKIRLLSFPEKWLVLNELIDYSYKYTLESAITIINFIVGRTYERKVRKSLLPLIRLTSGQ